MADATTVSIAAVERFMGSVWGEKDEGTGWILVWGGAFRDGDLTEKESRWAATSAGAADAARQMAEAGKDVYVGVSTRRDRPPAPERGGSDDSASVCGLWADLDCGDEKKSQKRYPPDEAAISRLLASTGRRPTVAVWSGRGVHAWWLLKEPLELPDAMAREAASFASKSWQAFLSARAREIGGWAVDSTADLARVLRVSGTVNRKVPGDPRPVYTMWDDGPRYGDLSDVLSAIPAPGSKNGTGEIGGTPGAEDALDGVEVDAGAIVPLDKFEALCEAEPRFKNSWMHRRDFPDQSCSTYEMSLACMAAMSGWSRQEIVDLIVAHRKKYQPERMGKVLRRDYLARTLARAMASKEKQDEAGAVAEVQREQRGPEAPTKEYLVAQLSERLGLDVERVIKHATEDAFYTLVLASGGGRQVKLGVIDQVMTQKHVRCRIAEATETVIRAQKPGAWDMTVQFLLRAAELVNETIDRRGMFDELVEDYLSRGSIARENTDDGVGQAFVSGRPFVDEGRICISAKSFSMFLAPRLKSSRAEILDALRLTGFRYERATRRVGGKVIGRGIWSCSAERFPQVGA